MPGINYEDRYRDYARFTPAISEMYTRYVVNENPKREPPVSREALNFLDKNTGLFYLPCSLYSAGQAAKSASGAHRTDMVTGRDKAPTTILGDSGGFQIQTGAIKFKGDETRDRMMKWMEKNCDWSMILDFPTGGIAMGTIDSHMDRLTAPYDPELPDSGNAAALQALIDKNVAWVNANFPAEEAANFTHDPLFYTCMLQTIINNDYFMKHRTPGATKFLNVVQGRNPKESKIWYENVKHYDLEGWSLASHHKENFEMTLGRIINMRDDNLLADRNWMHFLGVGKFQHGCVYTTIQRMVREQINPNFTISYDVSSPFTLAAYGKVFVGYNLDKNSWSIQGEKLDGKNFLREGSYDTEHFKDVWATDKAGNPVWMKKKTQVDGVDVEEIILDRFGNYKPKMKEVLDYVTTTHYEGGPDSERPFLDVLKEMFDERLGKVSGGRFIETEVGKQLKMGDICVNGDPKFTSTWDVVTYALLMNHNIQVHLEGVYETQDLYDKSDRNRADFDPNAHEKVPTELLQIRDVIHEVFQSETPHDVILKNRKVLNLIAGSNAENGVVDYEGSGVKVANVRDHKKVLGARKEHEEALAEKWEAAQPTKMAGDDLFDFG